MSIEKIYAQLSCSNLKQSTEWFASLFGRAPDARPMKGLAEWHQQSAGFQLFENASNAGHGTLTLIVSNLGGEQSRLRGQGLGTPEIEPADTVRLLQLRDPDNNLVVLAEPLPS